MNIRKPFSGPDASELKRAVDLRPLVESVLGAPARRAADHDKYYSPFRDDHHRPSFVVYADGYKDYGGDGDAGDHYDFIMRRYQLNFQEAKEWLASFSGGLPVINRVKPTATATETSSEPPSTHWQRTLYAELEVAQQYLWSNAQDAQAVRDYLHNRGLADETIRAYGLGYNPKSRHVQVQNPITRAREKCWIAAGILIPIQCAGVLWAVRVRCRVGTLAAALNQMPDRYTGDKQAGQEYDKYLSVKGSKTTGTFFNGDQLVEGAKVLLVEGEFDAMLAQQVLGARVAVLTLGSASNRLNVRLKEQLKLARHVYLLLDEDTAGQGAAEKLALAIGDRAKKLNLPVGKDVTEFVVEHQGDLAAWFDQCLRPGSDGRLPLTSTPGNAYVWASGVPNGCRSAVLNVYPESCALLQELLNTGLQLGELNPQGFTVPQLLDLRDNAKILISKRSLYSALEAVNGEFVRKLDATRELSSSAANSCKKTERGRCAEVWQLLPKTERKQHLLTRLGRHLVEKYYPVDGEHPVLAPFTSEMMKVLGYETDYAQQMVDVLDNSLGMIQEQQGEHAYEAARKFARELRWWQNELQDLDSIPLSKDVPINNAAGFRAAFLRSHVAHYPQACRSHHDFERLLGIGHSSIKATCQRAGVKTTEQFEPLHLKKADAVKFESKIQQFGRKRRGFPLKIAAFNAQGRFIGSTLFKDAAKSYETWAKLFQQRGRLEVVFQVPNRQELLEFPIVIEPQSSLPVENLPTLIEASPSTQTSSVPILPKKPKTFGDQLSDVTEEKRVRRAPAYKGRSHNPIWVDGQLKLAFILQGWVSDDRLLDPMTGEIFLELPPSRVLIEILLQQAGLQQQDRHIA
jgi:5S rRNA maturation endonuclease (ribonuclease M5)